MSSANAVSPNVLVLGIGNRLMRDDAVGIVLAERLASAAPDGVQIAVGETDVEYCLDLALPSKFVVVLDAVMTGQPPGTVTVWPLAAAAAGPAGFSQHDHHFLQMLRRYSPTKQGVLIGIEAGDIGVGMRLTEVLYDQLDSLVASVTGVIQNCVGVWS